MASAVDKFDELEEQILRAIEVVKATQAEKETAEKQLTTAQARIERLERELDQLKNERDLVRIKVESLLETLSQLTGESVV